MGKHFNTEGQCIPELHYMVPLDDRLIEIKRRYVDQGSYFMINRGRQYGKTTTLRLMAEYLKRDYIVLFMDFQIIGEGEFENEALFSLAFAEVFMKVLCRGYGEQGKGLAEPLRRFVDGETGRTLRRLFDRLSEICAAAPKPVVLMIDEVDSASNNQVFIDFLAQLRGYYLDRDNSPIFHSVVLAGVYDIKNLKLKIRPEKEHKFNSPWNIAVKFSMDMSFSAEQIAVMLDEYEEEKHVGMDVKEVSEEIYRCTSGYPYLVSAICKILDEELLGKEGFPDGRGLPGKDGFPDGRGLPGKDGFSDGGGLPEGGDRGCVWSAYGIGEAVKIILNENAPLFDSMVKQLDMYQELRGMMEELIYQGKRIPFSPDEKAINIGLMFGFLKEEDGKVIIANRIFEMRLLNLFIAEESVGSEIFFYGQGSRNQFVKDRKLDMKLVLEKFAQHFTEVYGSNDEKFTEKYGRKFFLLYLKPIINGVGNYYLEAQTRDARRTDVIVDYAGEQFIVELKIWHGNEYHERGEEQLTEYLEYYHKDKGYLLSFNFNKNKETGVREVQIGSRTIVEAVV